MKQIRSLLCNSCIFSHVRELLETSETSEKVHFSKHIYYLIIDVKGIRLKKYIPVKRVEIIIH